MFNFFGLHIRIVLAGLLSLTLHEATSQVFEKTQNVEVTVNKTSSILFAANITAVDRGSKDVLAQKPKGIDNVLQLKAGRTNFRETNLTVITSDGKLHHFFVRYSDHPATFTVEALDSSPEPSAVNFKSEMTDTEMKTLADRIISHDEHIIKNDSKFDMRLSLNGIYIKGNVMFFHVRIQNKSNISYHPDMLRFYVKDNKSAKRTSSQEIGEEPLYVYGDATVIGGKTSTDLVYAIPKFTIPDAKRLNIELMEKRGGRHLKLEIKNRAIIRAKAI